MGNADDVASAAGRSDDWSNREQSGRKLRSPPVGEKAEVANTHKAARQQVKQERRKNSSTGRVMSRFLLP